MRVTVEVEHGGEEGMPQTKSKRQVRKLLSKGSPLSGEQKDKLLSELHSGAVKVEKGPIKPPKDASKRSKDR